MIRIKGCTGEEIEILEEHYRKSETSLIRERSHAVLLSTDGESVPRIGKILRRPENTVRSWLQGFERERISSLFPRYEGNTNAGKLTKEQKEEIAETLSKPPSKKGIPASFWSVKALKTYLKASYGVEYESDRSYHHIFEIAKFTYKLPETLDKRRNDALVEIRMVEIRKELEAHSGAEWVCFAADESSIVWETEIRRAWLKKGEKTILKADRTKQRQNYFGALNLKTGQHTLIPLSWQNTETMIEALRVLTKAYPNKKLCLVWDNAKWHRSNELKALLGKGKEFSHIHLIWLPPYAPDHNPQEHVWKVGKEAISNAVYATFKELSDTFEKSLAGKLFNYKI